MNKCCPAVQVSLTGEKILSSNSSLPGVDSLSNVDFLYKCVFLLQKVYFYSVFRSSPISTVS